MIIAKEFSVAPVPRCNLTSQMLNAQCGERKQHQLTIRLRSSSFVQLGLMQISRGEEREGERRGTAECLLQPGARSTSNPSARINRNFQGGYPHPGGGGM